jgi:hypothetical protein
MRFAGESHTDKIQKVREELEKKKAKAMVVNMLDEVAWLFNLRGSDIDFNPGKTHLLPSIHTRYLLLLRVHSYSIATFRTLNADA